METLAFGDAPNGLSTADLVIFVFIPAGGLILVVMSYVIAKAIRKGWRSAGRE